MRRIAALTIQEIQRALDDLQRQINALKEDVGEFEIPTGTARVPRDGSARMYYDVAGGKIVIVTEDGTNEWSAD